MKNKLIKDVLNVVLQDDDTEYGGVSFSGETVADFISDAGLTQEQPIEELNSVLKECGIKEIELWV